MCEGDGRDGRYERKKGMERENFSIKKKLWAHYIQYNFFGIHSTHLSVSECPLRAR
jgi:hypothetical protein